MNEKELLQAIREIVKEEIQPVRDDLQKVKEDIEELKENTEVTRVATNTLVAWAEKASVEVKIPLFDKAQ